MLQEIETKYKNIIDMLYNQIEETECHPQRVKLLTGVVNSYVKVVNELDTKKQLQELSNRLDELEKQGVI